MQLAIRHITTFRYSRPVRYEIQALRLTPRSYRGLAVKSWDVRGERNRALRSFIDGFGNVVHTNSINRPHENAVVAAFGTVETAPVRGAIEDARDRLPPVYFLRPTPLTQADAAVAALAAEGARGPGPLDRLAALMHAVGERVRVRRSTAYAAASAGEALAAGAGVCHDHAHIFIAACRALGIPSRYVGGYYWPGDGHPRDQASHAWAEAYVEDRGWTGFDPATLALAGERHVRVAVGLDYHGAAPVRGVRRGEADETLTVALDVAAAQATQ